LPSQIITVSQNNSYILKLYVPIHPYIVSVGIVVNQLEELKLEFVSLNRRVGFLELQNKNQKEVNRFLKDQLNSKQKGEIVKQDRQQGKSGDVAKMTWHKRPARLFPANFFK